MAAYVQKNAVKILNTLKLSDLFDQKLGSLKRHCLGLMIRLSISIMEEPVQVKLSDKQAKIREAFVCMEND